MLQTGMWRSVLHSLLGGGGRQEVAPHLSSTFIKHAGVCACVCMWGREGVTNHVNANNDNPAF